MKTFIRIDFVLQSFLLAIAVFSLLANFTVSSEFLLFFLIAQFFTGLLQMGSALVHLIASSPEKKLRILHFSIAGIFLTVFFIITPLGGLAFIASCATAWLLAIVYYVITWRLTFPSKAKGSGFLPHLSF